MTDLPLPPSWTPGSAGRRQSGSEFISRADRTGEPGMIPILLPHGAVTVLTIFGLIAYGLWGFGLVVGIDSAAIGAILLYLAGRSDGDERITIADGMITVSALTAEGEVRRSDRFPLFGLQLERTELTSGEVLRLDLRYRDRCREVGRALSPAERRRLWLRMTDAIAQANATARNRTCVLPTRR